MRGLFKTLFGDLRTLCAAAICLLAAALLLRSSLAIFTGALLPLGLLGAAAYLARR